MNRLNFKTSISKTQYDLYKYKIGDYVSYGKRKVYRYPVNGVVYDLKTEIFFKYLYKLQIPEERWEVFIKDDWETLLHELNLYEDVIDQIKGLVEFNGFKDIKLPDGLELTDLKLNPNSELELIVDWFRDESIRPNDKQVYFIIFHY